MKKNAEKFTRSLYILLRDSDYLKIENDYRNTTKRNMSEYVRSLLFDKPVTFFTRDKSLDELVEVLIAMRKDLRSLRNQGEAIHQELQDKAHNPEGYSMVKQWEDWQNQMLKLLQNIHHHITLIGDKWLQE